MKRCPKAVGGALVAVLASTACAGPALAADDEPARSAADPIVQLQVANLDTLLRDLLGTQEQERLLSILGLLGDGQQTTAFAQLRALLDHVAATPGLSPQTKALIEDVAALLGDGTAAVGPALLAPVAALLHGLADVEDLPPATATLLDDLGDALGSAQVPGLPLDRLTLDPGVVADVEGVLSALGAGAGATGETLAPLVPLLEQLASTVGLPAPLANLADQLANTIGETSGPLDALTAGQLATLLRSIGNTAGVPGSTRTIIIRTANAIDGPGSAGSTGVSPKRAATAADRARIAGVRLNRARTVARVRIVCPRSAPAVCATKVSATLGTRGSAATAKRVRVAPGKRKLVRLRLVRSARSSIATQGGWLRVKAVTTFGTRRYAAKRSLRIPPPAQARRR